MTRRAQHPGNAGGDRLTQETEETGAGRGGADLENRPRTLPLVPGQAGPPSLDSHVTEVPSDSLERAPPLPSPGCRLAMPGPHYRGTRDQAATAAGPMAAGSGSRAAR